MTTYDFSCKQGDTFKGRKFLLSRYVLVASVAALPALGDPAVIYKASDTGLRYKWVASAYQETTDRKAIDLTGATIKMDVRKTRESTPVVTLTLLAGITVLDATAGSVQLNPQRFPMAAGAWKYDVEFLFPGDLTETLWGGVITVLEDLTHV